MPDADWKTAGSARQTLGVRTRCSLESGGSAMPISQHGMFTAQNADAPKRTLGIRTMMLK